VVRSASAHGSDSTRRLQARLAERFDVEPDAVVLTGTGTQALGLALRLAAREGPGRCVALPAYTCWDVGTAALWAGVEVAWYDIDALDLSPDHRSLEAALDSGVTAAVVSPLHGYPLDWDHLRSLCHDRGALLIEDAAQGHGSRWRGKPTGSFGDLSVLSFGRGKGWTGAGGGALLVRSPEVSASSVGTLARAGPGSVLPWLGAALGQAVLGRPATYGLPAALPGTRLGETAYHPPRAPRAMSPSTAALVLATEQRADAEVEVRRRTATRFLECLAPEARVHAIRPSYADAGFLRLPVRVPDPSPAWERTARRLGVVRGYPLALPDVDELRSNLATHPLGGAPFPLPGARLLAAQLFTVPTHSLLERGDLERIDRLLSGA
jgi:dTDP-4-amino-4,6-dideoxygalactose transaminase